MTKRAHTIGPWIVEDFDHVTMIVAGPETPSGKMVIAEILSDPVEENARRIVAAVNACEGIPTEALEGGVVQELTEVIDRLLDHMMDGRMDEPDDREAELIEWANEVTTKCFDPTLCIRCQRNKIDRPTGSVCSACAGK